MTTPRESSGLQPPPPPEAATLPPAAIVAALPESSESATLVPAAATFPACDAVPGYEVLRELGRGGMGIISSARQTKLGRVVALKMIRGGALRRGQ